MEQGSTAPRLDGEMLGASCSDKELMRARFVYASHPFDISTSLTELQTQLSDTMGFLLKPPPDTPGKAWPAIVIGLFVAFGGVLYG
jgi:hypothetical protein